MARDDKSTASGGSAPAAKRPETISERIAKLESEIRRRPGVNMSQSNELAALRAQLKLRGD